MEDQNFFPFIVVHPSSSLATSFCRFPKEILESTRQTEDEESSNKTLSLAKAKIGIPKAKTIRIVGPEMIASLETIDQEGTIEVLK